MRIKPIRQDLAKFISRHNLNAKFTKQLTQFIQNPFHPSLQTEILNPKAFKLYSFRLDQKYRVIFIKISENEIEIVDINNHYQ